MGILEKIKNLIATLEKDKQFYIKELSDLREKHQNYDRHYKVKQTEESLEKCIFAIEQKIEVLTELIIH